MDIAYTSENKLYRIEDGCKTELTCGRIVRYREAIESIRRRSEWKTTGKGAQFTGQARQTEPENIQARISGLAANGDKLVYACLLDDSSCCYQRTLEKTDNSEGLILSGNDIFFGAFDCYQGKMAVSLGHSRGELHIAVMEPPSSAYTEYTDGDTMEENPWWSRHDKNRIYFSTAGNARDEYGGVGAVSPRSGAYIDIEAGEMKEFLSDPEYDYIRIKDDSQGNIYCIRQPYEGEKNKGGIKFTDILFFPFRIIKAFFGWLNFISIIWGGESLKNGGKDDIQSGFARSKNRSPKDIIIEGNIINAEKLGKAEDDDMSGVMPLSRVLMKIDANGSGSVIKKGVLDYTVCADGSLLVSNGRHITRIAGERETHVAKANLAMNLTVIGE